MNLSETSLIRIKKRFNSKLFGMCFFFFVIPIITLFKRKTLSPILDYPYLEVYLFTLLFVLNDFYQYIRFRNRYVIQISNIELVTYNNNKTSLIGIENLKIKKERDFIFNIFLYAKSNFAFMGLDDKTLESVIFYVNNRKYYINPYFFDNPEKVIKYLYQFPIKKEKYWGLNE